MRRTALILAGAVAFDLGVMAVSAQAQQADRQPSPASGQTGPATSAIPGAVGSPEALLACAQGKHIPDARVSACREPAAAPQRQAAVDYHIKLSAAYPARACTAARGQVVTHEGVQQCRLPGPAR